MRYLVQTAPSYFQRTTYTGHLEGGSILVILRAVLLLEG